MITVAIDSVATRGTITVAYQGGPGANGERAIATHWQGTAQGVPLRTFGDVVAAAADGVVDFGIVPIWNSTIGEVGAACGVLESLDERIEQVAHVAVDVRHALLVVPGASLALLRAVASHPAALAQCRRFLATHPGVTQVEAWDTAGAAVELAMLARPRLRLHRESSREASRAVPPYAGPAPWHAGIPDAAPHQLAAIASADVAGSLGLVVLARDIQDDPNNRTRFVVVRARDGAWRW